MLVQALAEYADNYLADELNDAAWEMKPVPWLLEISQRGTFLNATQRMTTETRGKKQVRVPMPISMPRSPVNRNSGEHPLLGTDDIAYVLGIGPWTPDKSADKEKAEKHHEAFVALIAKAAAETGDGALGACTRFYANAEDLERARNALKEAKPGTLVALSVGEPLVERESVQQFWRKHYEAAFAGRMEGSDGECMISGKFGPIAPTHEKIKGVSSLGGQAAGVALMSFDKDAFRSYGWEQNRNSPVSPDRALAYVLAFNDLLKQDKGRRKDIAGIGFLYWLKNPADLDALDLMDRADPSQVKKLLGFDARSEPDANRFYMVAVSGNGGRLRVHHWADLALTQVKENLKNWHEQLRVEFPWDEPAPVRLWQLLYALDREGKPDDHTVLALLRRGIEGVPLGYSVLSTALTRLRHPGGSDSKEKTGEKKSDPMSLARLRVPMGLIRMCINDLFLQQEGARKMSEGLDPGCTIPAYICGRLMAEFENLQRSSSENEVNSSILDRYFALASTYPAVAFPKIENLGQKHLRKLRRDNPPAAYAIDARLQELHNLLQPSASGAYPGKLGLEGQGLFALGYYHQKARSRSKAQDRKQANDAEKESTNESTDQENNR
ncbi:MAG TPA: type I-C CRISPR-associated protein Cas8c/Csd1 [Edaphobacter sp.]|uniref:type I-C CRISPR-associated protein Cas8c/Csd1 n=1 Tax=Edaphobacter sp. TaxID=1934404 RepID=UPI002BB9CFEF|nr:type I-C CRISPR-associated protein Cas8c/Csd1 [Edaphobacter sp.]HUZ95878.1 type I-C CRISPR-associated protein Cas8c/Csd1 [Edaphobacter sp.]